MDVTSTVDDARIFERVGGNSYLKVDLDTITHNVALIRSKCALETGLIAVVSQGAYGLGSVVISRHLKNLNVERLAVQTLREAIHLRAQGIGGPLHVLENAIPEHASYYFNHDLIPTVCSSTFLANWNALHQKRHLEYIETRETSHSSDEDSSSLLPSILAEDTLPPKKIAVEVDTGVVRTGLDWQSLDRFMEICEKWEIAVDSIFTHLVSDASTTHQMDHFNIVSGKFRTGSTYLHAADSRAVLCGHGTDLDFVRVGSALYGCTTIDDETLGVIFLEHSYMRPAVSWVAAPSVTTDTDWTLSVGTDDGFHGRVVRLDDDTVLPVTELTRNRTVISIADVDMENRESNVCHLMTPNFHSVTSCFALAKQCGYRRPLDVVSAISARVPRVYVDKEQYFVQSDYCV